VRTVHAIESSLLPDGDGTVTYTVRIPSRDGTYRKQTRKTLMSRFAKWARKRVTLETMPTVQKRERRIRFHPDQITAGVTYTNNNGCYRTVELVDRHEGRVLYDLIDGHVSPMMKKEGDLYSCTLETFIRWAVRVAHRGEL